METSKTNRETIFNAIRASLPDMKVEHPGIPVFQRPAAHLQELFEQHLNEAGGAAHDVASAAGVGTLVKALHPTAKVSCSAVPETAGTRRIGIVKDPHELADVDVGVVRAQFGVAESHRQLWMVVVVMVFAFWAYSTALEGLEGQGRGSQTFPGSASTSTIALPWR